MPKTTMGAKMEEAGFDGSRLELYALAKKIGAGCASIDYLATTKLLDAITKAPKLAATFVSIHSMGDLTFRDAASSMMRRELGLPDPSRTFAQTAREGVGQSPSETHFRSAHSFSSSRLRAMSAAKDTVAEAVFRVRGRDIIEYTIGELEQLIAKNDSESRVMKAVLKHTANAPRNAIVGDVVKRDVLAKIVKESGTSTRL